MTDKSASAHRRLVIAFSVLVFVAGGMFLIASPLGGARATFASQVIRPIPQSVQNIKMDRCPITPFMSRFQGTWERALVVRFDVSKEDLSRIVVTHGFMPWVTVECTSGTLRYKTTDGSVTDIRLYRERHRRSPSWFDLEKWRDAETYFVGQATPDGHSVDVSLLVYNDQVGSAYFIRRQVTTREVGY